MRTLIAIIIIGIILFATGILKFDGGIKLDGKKTAGIFEDKKVVLFKGLLLKPDAVGGEKSYNHIKNFLDAPYNAQRKILSYVAN